MKLVIERDDGIGNSCEEEADFCMVSKLTSKSESDWQEDAQANNRKNSSNDIVVLNSL